MSSPARCSNAAVSEPGSPRFSPNDSLQSLIQAAPPRLGALAAAQPPMSPKDRNEFLVQVLEEALAISDSTLQSIDQ